ncbi:hypothetical protein CORC01_12551 [Colletotrichum orchidophilum]|uniref:Zn(2)-C6 fungal-type domain-containing protein n=1 Tax=Colletotrichum orchidophilum TaxID=1209926 RepID=A0A1G4ASK8_9PEZI|nr:uncharacterized protein CORC01_12551 [Colletotrichum orchidophilum]OHE92148.1 hypothetical protein CORC01_12551 [Colletotrichum orchidophilum]
MPASETPPSDDARKRRAHKKSRKGCGNCKLRRVKCDETKPKCVKCVSYGVTCSYAPTSAATALSVEVAFKVDLSSTVTTTTTITTTTPTPPQPKQRTCSAPPLQRAAPPPRAQPPFPPRYVPPPLPCTGSMESPDAAYQLTPTDVRLLERFQKRTILSLGTPRSRSIYEKKTLPIAFCVSLVPPNPPLSSDLPPNKTIKHPVVMHTVIAMTHLHDMSLTPNLPPTPGTQTALAYHWYRGVSLLHRKLSAPILPAERDALWLASAFIGVAAFANVATLAAPRDAWPLRDACASDLDWMKLGDGKKQVWKMTDTPCAPRGVFSDVANELYAQLMQPDVLPIGGDDGGEDGGTTTGTWSPLPEGFADLFGLREDPTHANPYFSAAVSLVACWRIPASADPDSRELVKPFMGFISKLDPRFRRLLEEKDERAMLLLAYWFARVCDRKHWWMCKRAVLETWAICEYLETRWKGRWEVRLVEFPRMMADQCGL